MSAPVPPPPADDQAARADLPEAEQYVRSEAFRRGWRTVAAAHSEALSVVLAEYDRRAEEIENLRDAFSAGMVSELRGENERDVLRARVAAVRALADDLDPEREMHIADAIHEVLDGPAEAPADPHLSEWQTQMRGFLGKRVEVVLNKDPRKVVVGVLHHFDTDGQVYVEDEDGSWGWAWPCLDIAVAVGPAEAAEPARAKAGDRVQDGGHWGTLVRCPQCDGDGLLHQLDPAELERMQRESAEPAQPEWAILNPPTGMMAELREELRIEREIATEEAAENTVRSGRYSVTFDDLFRVPDGWMSWRCLLGWTTVAPGYEDGACRYDHNVDSWEQLASETSEHLACWHPHIAALAGSTPKENEHG